MTRLGEYRDIVTIEQRSPTLDSAGQRVGWMPFARAYAKVEPLARREQLSAGMLATPIDVRVKMPYLGGVTPAMRIVFETRTLNIQAVADVDNLHRELSLMCVEVE